jgi:GNAT superfamily N-acetyltransferase
MAAHSMSVQRRTEDVVWRKIYAVETWGLVTVHSRSGAFMSAQPAALPFQIRRATIEDAKICGPVCYLAFKTINDRHNFPPDLPSPEVATQLLSSMFSNPDFYGVVAEAGGRVIGSNCLDERGMIAGVGPITISPDSQNVGVGRALMEAVMDRATERSFAGVRLVQAAFHGRSMSLYAKLGFIIREPLAVMQGNAKRHQASGVTVRSVLPSDLPACNALCHRVHGHDRARELENAVESGTARLVERAGRVVAYTSALAFFGHSVAETNEDMAALIASADTMGGPGILVPTRNTELFRWCLESGLRFVEPTTLMSVGLYNEPRGAFLPSILF